MLAVRARPELAIFDEVHTWDEAYVQDRYREVAQVWNAPPLPGVVEGTVRIAPLWSAEEPAARRQHFAEVASGAAETQWIADEVWTSAIRQSFETMRRGFAAMAETIGTIEWWIPEFEGVAAAAEDPQALARRRHGPAAVCPRHGETRGGTCLRCLR